MSSCNFSYDHYKQTLKEIQNIRKFSTFKNCSKNDIILRHDVDGSLNAALKIAKIEHDLGIQSTFFILFTSEFYNPFSIDSSKIIREILQLGHKVGLHYSELYIEKNNLELSEAVRKEIEILEHHFSTPVEAVAAHESRSNPRAKVSLPEGVKNAYSDEFFVKRKYLSDSAQYWREGCFCKHYMNYDSMQVLIHPMWWSEDNKSRTEIMKNFVNGEYDDYASTIDIAAKKHENHFKKISQNKHD